MRWETPVVSSIDFFSDYGIEMFKQAVFVSCGRFEAASIHPPSKVERVSLIGPCPLSKQTRSFISHHFPCFLIISLREVLTAERT